MTVGGIPFVPGPLEDVATTELDEATDVVTGYAKGVKDVVGGARNAVEDYGHGWSRAFQDARHGDLAKATLDLVEGGIKAPADMVAGEVKGVVDVASGAVNAVEDAFGLGGGDKKKELELVGRQDPKLVEQNDAEQNTGKAQLQQIKARLASKNPSAFGTADDILNPGSAGMHYFDYFLPAYNRFAGQNITIDSIRQAYDRERGMSFTAFTADAKLLAAASTETDTITEPLQTAYNALVPSWQGPAAWRFESAMTTYFTADQNVSKTLADAGKGISSMVVAIQNLVHSKASTVSGLYLDKLQPGVDGVQALQAMVAVAQNNGSDPLRRWVLGTLGQPIHGLHGWDSDGTYSMDALDDPSRQLARKVAGEWCSKVLVPQTEQRLAALGNVCAATTSAIRKLIGRFAGDAKAITDPFASMPTALPGSNGTTSPSAGGSGGGGSSGAGGNASGSSGSSGSSGGGYSGGIPPVDAGSGETVPTGIDPPGTTGTGTAGITTNADGSVSLGTDQNLTIGNDSGGQGFTLTENSGGTPHDYQVTYDASGHPHVLDTTAATPAAAPDTGAGVRTQMSLGTQFGAQDPSGAGQTSAAASLPTQAGSPPAAGTPGAASGTSSPIGMPMMGGMGSMGRGGGGEQELRRRYATQTDGVVDQDELEEWDRLGPTIG